MTIFELMAPNACTLDRQAIADSNKSTAVAARPAINHQSLRPKGDAKVDSRLVLAMKKAYHKSARSKRAIVKPHRRC